MFFNADHEEEKTHVVIYSSFIGLYLHFITISLSKCRVSTLEGMRWYFLNTSFHVRSYVVKCESVQTPYIINLLYTYIMCAEVLRQSTGVLLWFANERHLLQSASPPSAEKRERCSEPGSSRGDQEVSSKSTKHRVRKTMHPQFHCQITSWTCKSTHQ